MEQRQQKLSKISMDQQHELHSTAEKERVKKEATKEHHMDPLVKGGKMRGKERKKEGEKRTYPPFPF